MSVGLKTFNEYGEDAVTDELQKLCGMDIFIPAHHADKSQMEEV